jgi:hypothetical protein
MDTPSLQTVSSFKLLLETPHAGAEDVLAAAHALKSQLRSLEHQHALAQAMHDEKSAAVQALEEELVRLLRARRGDRTLEKDDAHAGGPQHAPHRDFRTLGDDGENSWVHLTVNWDDESASLDDDSKGAEQLPPPLPSPYPSDADHVSMRLSEGDMGSSFGRLLIIVRTSWNVSSPSFHIIATRRWPTTPNIP